MPLPYTAFASAYPTKPTHQRSSIYHADRFSKIEEVRVPNFKGGEKELLKKAYADGRNCIMLDRLMPGASIGRHTHETNSEIMYIVSGTATFTVGDTVETVQAGQCHYCPKGRHICSRTAAASRSCSSLSLRNSKGSTT